MPVITQRRRRRIIRRKRDTRKRRLRRRGGSTSMQHAPSDEETEAFMDYVVNELKTFDDKFDQFLTVFDFHVTYMPLASACIALDLAFRSRNRERFEWINAMSILKKGDVRVEDFAHKIFDEATVTALLRPFTREDLFWQDLMTDDTVLQSMVAPHMRVYYLFERFGCIVEMAQQHHTDPNELQQYIDMLIAISDEIGRIHGWNTNNSGVEEIQHGGALFTFSMFQVSITHLIILLMLGLTHWTLYLPFSYNVFKTLVPSKYMNGAVQDILPKNYQPSQYDSIFTSEMWLWDMPTALGQRINYEFNYIIENTIDGEMFYDSMMTGQNKFIKCNPKTRRCRPNYGEMQKLSLSGTHWLFNALQATNGSKLNVEAFNDLLRTFLPTQVTYNNHEGTPITVQYDKSEKVYKVDNRPVKIKALFNAFQNASELFYNARKDSDSSSSIWSWSSYFSKALGVAQQIEESNPQHLQVLAHALLQGSASNIMVLKDLMVDLGKQDIIYSRRPILWHLKAIFYDYSIFRSKQQQYHKEYYGLAKYGYLSHVSYQFASYVFYRFINVWRNEATIHGRMVNNAKFLNILTEVFQGATLINSTHVNPEYIEDKEQFDALLKNFNDNQSRLERDIGQWFNATEIKFGSDNKAKTIMEAQDRMHLLSERVMQTVYEQHMLLLKLEQQYAIQLLNLNGKTRSITHGKYAELFKQMNDKLFMGKSFTEDSMFSLKTYWMVGMKTQWDLVKMSNAYSFS